MRHLSFVSPTFNPNSLWGQLDELFQSEAREVATFEPRADVEETEQSFKISLDLPGVKETDVDLKLEDRRLTLRAKREEVRTEEKAGQSLRRERFFGEFVRSFRLPPNVDVAAIDASMKNGVLEVTLPKAAEAQPKSIPVKVN